MKAIIIQYLQRVNDPDPFKLRNIQYRVFITM